VSGQHEGHAGKELVSHGGVPIPKASMAAAEYSTPTGVGNFVAIFNRSAIGTCRELSGVRP
jgi:hypothetical protein